MPPWMMSLLQDIQRQTQMQQIAMQQRAMMPRQFDPYQGVPSDGGAQSYGEGQTMAPQQWWNPALDPERGLFSGPQRTDPLTEQLNLNNWARQNNWLLPGNY